MADAPFTFEADETLYDLTVALLSDDPDIQGPANDRMLAYMRSPLPSSAPPFVLGEDEDLEELGRQARLPDPVASRHARERMSAFLARPPRPTTPAPFHGTTVVEIPVPSGRLVVGDDLRILGALRVPTRMSVNYGAGLDAWAQDLARLRGVAYAFVGNTCPQITQRPDGSLVAVSPAWEDGAPVMADGETTRATVVTDHWAVMMIDAEVWAAFGGRPVAETNAAYAVERFTEVEVVPGRYRWTVDSHDDDFDHDAPGRIEFARLERVGDIV